MRLVTICILASTASVAIAQNSRCLIPGMNPGRAEATGQGTILRLSNDVIQVALDFSSKRMQLSFGTVGSSCGYPQNEGVGFTCSDLFSIRMQDGSVQESSGMRLAATPAIRNIRPVSNHPAGKAIHAEFASRNSSLRVNWEATLLNGSNYVREVWRIEASKDVPAAEVVLLDGGLQKYRFSEFISSVSGVTANPPSQGSVPGSPVAEECFFLGAENPMSRNTITYRSEYGSNFRCSINRKNPFTPGAPVTYYAVIGVAPPNQMRRGFLNYLERERAHPYRTFLHYNSWLDISYGEPFTADQSVERINAVGEELNKKRGVKLESFLFDDGWDDTHTVWKFNKGFPNGFTPLAQAAAQYGAAPGAWLSPWGGYGDARTQRLATGKAEGYEIDRQGYALSGPKYYDRFHQVCMDFVKKYNVNQFKFDGTGSPDKHTPGSRFDSDFDAAISLISDLRQAKPDLFINLTTGTWPSPFWLRYADTTWRGGDDSSFAGVGTWRQKWITYRDSQTYRNIVSKAPLYPLSSLMLHGIIYATHADHLSDDPGNDFRDEVRSYFGSGTELQELYITPSLLSKQNWDDLAEAAKWSAANKDVLLDTHWVGGDPAELGVYGWASWSPRKGCLVLRNPSDKAQSFSVDVAKALEVPAGSKFKAHSPWKEDAGQPSLFLNGRVNMEFKPFEVKVLDLYPE